MLESLKAMPMKGKLTLAGSALGVVLVAFFLLQLATKPSYETLMSGVQPADTAKVTTALDGAGIAYELQNNGTAIAVQKGTTADARVALASAGVDTSSTSQPGFEDLMAKQKLGTSDFQQKVTYQRALEGEIAKTIDGVAGSGGARVQLSLPGDQLFADEEKPATASVLLGSGSENIEPAQVRGIASLVAGAVEGLKKDEVTITDSSGNMLWPQGDGSDTGATMTKTQAEARYAAQVQAQLTAMLDKTVGDGKAQVTVRPDLDVDKTTQDKVTYAKTGTPLEESTETESLTGAGAAAAAGGQAGVTGNVAAGTNANGAGATGSGSNYRKNSTTTKNGVNKTVERRTLAPGAVKRMDVAVLVDSASKPDLAAIRNALSSAAGIQAARGDTLSVQAVAFAKPPATPAAKAGPIPAGAATYAKYVALGLGVLLFLFFVTRAIRKRERSSLGEPTWLTEISAPRSVSELGDGSQAALAAGASQRPADRLGSQDPALVAQQLRTWMAED
jgi:flagellar M-ring protein FliF